MAETKPAKAESSPFTRSPNVFYDEWLPQLSGEAVVKIINIVTRYTYGWHCDAVELALDDFELLTGLSRKPIVQGLHNLIKEHKFVARIKINGKRFAYYLNLRKSGESKLLEKCRIYTFKSGESKLFKVENLHFSDVSPYYIKEKETTSLGKKGRKKEIFPSENPPGPLTFELTNEHREWVNQHTPEVAHLVEQEVEKMLNWCNDPDHPERARKIRATKSGIITDKRFHNWMFKASEFFLQRPRLELKFNQPTTTEKNQKALDEFKEQEGIV